MVIKKTKVTANDIINEAAPECTANNNLECAKLHVNNAIEELAKCADCGSVVKESIANLSVVLMDLQNISI